MKLLAFAASLISIASAVSTTTTGYTGWGGGYQREFQYKVNRLSEQYETGDAKYAACKFHKVRRLPGWCLERNFSATIFVEQKFDDGADPKWQQPDAFFVARKLNTNVIRNGADVTDPVGRSLYQLQTVNVAEYDPLRCERRDPDQTDVKVGTVFQGSAPTAQKTLAMSSTNGLIGDFSLTDDNLNYDAAWNNLYD